MNTSRFRTILPTGLNLHDQRTFQKAKKNGILKPSHFTKLSLVRPRNTFPIHSFLHMVRARHLKSLQYKTYEEFFNDISSSTFGKLLPHSYSSKLRRLCIELERCYQPLDGPKFPALAKTIHTLPTLHELYLKFCSHRRLGPKDVANDKELVNLAHELCRLVCLRKLHIEFNDCQKISDHGISMLTGPFSRLIGLQDCSFSLTKSNAVTDNTIAGVLGSLRRISGLTSLCVDLNGSHKVGDRSVETLAEVISGLPQLKRLCVRLEGCQVTHKAAKEFLKAVEGLEELEEWELWLGVKRRAASGGSKVSQNSSGNVYIFPCKNGEFIHCSQDYVKSGSRERRENLRLGKTLAGLKKLKKVKLSIDESWMQGNDVIWGLSWAFPQLKEINELSLRLCSRNWSQTVDDENMQMLCKAISQLKESLQVLHLDFQWSKIITDGGMASIAEAISMLRELRELHLSFEEWNKVTDRGIISLARGLGSLNSLERLVLRLTGLYRIEDEGLCQLSEALVKLKRLASLHLSIERCSKVTCEALEKLGGSLGQLLDFQELEIDLCGCEGLEGISILDILARNLGRLADIYEISCTKFLLKESVESDKSGARTPENFIVNGSREVNSVVSL